MYGFKNDHFLQVSSFFCSKALTQKTTLQKPWLVRGSTIKVSNQYNHGCINQIPYLWYPTIPYPNTNWQSLVYSCCSKFHEHEYLEFHLTDILLTKFQFNFTWKHICYSTTIWIPNSPPHLHYPYNTTPPRFQYPLYLHLKTTTILRSLTPLNPNPPPPPGELCTVSWWLLSHEYDHLVLSNTQRQCMP